MEVCTSVNKLSYFEPSYSWVYKHLENNSAYNLRNMNKIHYAVKIVNYKLNQKYGSRVFIKLNQEYQNWYGEHSITMHTRTQHLDDLKILKYIVQLNFVTSQSYFHQYEYELTQYVASIFKWLGVEIDIHHPAGTMSSGSMSVPPLNHRLLPYESVTHLINSVNISGQDMYSVSKTTGICFDCRIEKFSKPKIEYVFDYDWEKREEEEKSLMSKIKEYLRWS